MKLSTARKKEWLTGYLFIAPPVLGFLLFGMIPIVFSVVVSFSEYDFFTKQLNFVGLANYAEAFSDRIFFKSIGNIGLALMGVGVQLVVTIGVALLLTTEVKGTVLFRALFFLPVLCSSVAVTLVWKWVYNYDFGILNKSVGKAGNGKGGLADQYPCGDVFHDSARDMDGDRERNGHVRFGDQKRTVAIFRGCKNRRCKRL